MKVEIINTYHSKQFNCIGKLTVSYNLLIEFKVTYPDKTILIGDIETKVNNKPNNMNEINERAKGIVLSHINMNA